jgi:hypothetical protein
MKEKDVTAGTVSMCRAMLGCRIQQQQQQQEQQQQQQQL